MNIKRSIKYFGLLSILLVSFFLFSGGITDSQADLGPFINPPDIIDFKIVPANPSVYNEVTFEATVVNRSGKIEEDNCNKNSGKYKTTGDTPDMLKSEITIIKAVSDTIINKKPFTYSPKVGSNFYYKHSFSSAGTYKVISKFISTGIVKTKQESDTTIKVSEVTVVLGSGTIELLPGTYKLSGFRHISVSNSAPFETNDPAVLGNSTLTIDSRNNASLKADVKFDASTKASYPALNNNYKFDVSGKMSITKEPGTNKYAFRILYNDNVYATFDYTYDGTEFKLGYADDKKNQYIMTFRK